MAKDKEAPKMETVKEGIRLSSLLTVEVCNPVKEQIDKIEVCNPHIVTTCMPVAHHWCLPNYICKPDIFCRPHWFCKPDIMCRPIFYQYQEVCGPSQIEVLTIPDYEQVVADVKTIKEDIALLKQKIK